MSTKVGGFLAGGVAACGAVTVSHPFETVKTRYDYLTHLHACRPHSGKDNNSIVSQITVAR